jgi:hypothetical protein
VSTKIIGFGEQVSGYDIPVLNEREIRAAAGMLFLATFLSLMFILFRGNFVPIKHVITFFLADFLVRVLVNPRYAPTLVLGRLLVRNQVPEYVGAAQKRVAWIIGVLLSATMFLLMVVMNTYSPITGIICLVCLVFLFFEAAFGICLGCLAYRWIYREKARYCPGEICEVGARQPIQKTSGAQLLMLAAFAVAVAASGSVLGSRFAETPRPLFGPEPGAAEGQGTGQAPAR